MTHPWKGIVVRDTAKASPIWSLLETDSLLGGGGGGEERKSTGKQCWHLGKLKWYTSSADCSSAVRSTSLDK